MLYIKCSRDKKKLVELVAGDARFKEMDRKAADELERDVSDVEPIYHAVQQCAPEYDYEKIYQLLKDGQE